LAYHLYRRLCPGMPALMAGVHAGTEAAPRALRMLKAWGIEVTDHRATQITRELCYRADGIFVAAAPYAHRLLREYGMDLARKTYLYADPFTKPTSFRHGEYRVFDPSFDHKRSTGELVREFAWMRERSLAIRLALIGEGPRLVPASEYLALLQSVDPRSH